MSVSKEVIYGIIALVIGIGSVSALVLYQQSVSIQSMMKVHYMRNDQEIGSATGPLAVIGDYEGVTHIYFTITIKNTGEVPLTAYITGAEPSQFNSALSSATSFVIDVGQSHSWDSDLIDVSPFVGTTTTFTVHTKGEYTYADETNTLTKDASIDLTVQSDPLGGYDVIIESSTGETGGGGATTVPQTGTTVPQTTCWTVGTSCDPANHECCNLCEGTTTTSKSLVIDETDVSDGHVCCNQANMCCPSDSAQDCEVKFTREGYSGAWYTTTLTPGICLGTSNKCVTTPSGVVGHCQVYAWISTTTYACT